MKSRKAIAVGTAATAALAMGVSALGVASASAAPGTNSLAQVLTSDKNKFDRNSADFDVVTEAVLAVLAAKLDSPVGLLADGNVRLTAFVPTDRAFKNLASDLRGKKIRSEKRAFRVVASLGIDTVETVLLYHVIPGAKINANKVLKSNGARLTTAMGETVKVRVKAHPKRIVLVDKDRNDRNARVQVVNINKGNKQIAHGISQVLRPVDL
ncbi:MAG: fasciclin domain-containing protein [Actinobacteria bacterium]|nr:fasciclin domain-containing protein [Actinomycetota bacterium]